MFRIWIRVSLVGCVLILSRPFAGGAGTEAYDLVVYGATPGGVACAVRGAREDLQVCLISPYNNLGGLLSNGLSTMDTLYNGSRAPIYDELRQNIYSFYRDTYGEDSEQFQRTQPGHPKTRYEAHVVERLINELVDQEANITLIKNVYPVSVDIQDRQILSVSFKQRVGDEMTEIRGGVYADCSYEADLVAAAGVPYRVGREAKDEFNEAHAGVIYLQRIEWPPEPEDQRAWDIARDLNLYRYSEWFEIIDEASTGEAHPSVQGYNMRTVITRDPDNRIPIEKPEGYDPEPWSNYGFGNPDRPGLSMPNDKFGMNEPKLVGQQDPYVEGDWEERQRVTELHKHATLSLLYFRQNDPSVPAELRKAWREFGLPKDEFADNGHMPYEIYARETRRINGRAVFTENDASLAPGLDRAPIHADSISITEWFMDSHACTPRTVEGSEGEGKVMMKNETFPGQLSFETLFPENLDNFIVPVCLSTTHVGWGTIRLEPTWMSIAEAAAYAVVLAKEAGVMPSEIEQDRLVKLLADHRFLLTFFNDIEGEETSVWYPAIQYMGTKGFFTDYYARSEDTLNEELAQLWIDRTAQMLERSPETPMEFAQRLHRVGSDGDQVIEAKEFISRLSEAMRSVGRGKQDMEELLEQMTIQSTSPITRGQACRILFNVLKAD